MKPTIIVLEDGTKVTKESATEIRLMEEQNRKAAEQKEKKVKKNAGRKAERKTERE